MNKSSRLRSPSIHCSLTACFFSILTPDHSAHGMVVLVPFCGFVRARARENGFSLTKDKKDEQGELKRRDF
jgi:hypothetical protein